MTSALHEGDLHMLKHGPEAPTQDLEPLAGLFKLLSDGTRLRILLLLTKGERNVSSLCDELRLPQPTVSHHLGLLRMKHIISNRRHGKQVVYGLNGSVQSSTDTSLRISGTSYSIDISTRPIITE